ncbi:MAG: hypothetical protein HY815_05845 [Candidatus Riflebacteria bacterium]|nr:hypothetical protein [Candidatus Riflebacteria bacterium]
MDPRARVRPIAWLTLAFLVTLAHYSAIFHGPRSDQIFYLSATASTDDLASLTIGNWALNQSRAGDALLFRPLLYCLLGLERWAFGYQFHWWQLTSILLHLIVLVTLFELLSRWHRDDVWLPAALTVFFGLQYASMDQVIWHHLSAYLLCDIFLLLALRALEAVLVAPTVGRTAGLIFWLCLASFTYELGLIAAVVSALTLLWSSSRPAPAGDSGESPDLPAKHRRTAVLVALIPVAWAAVNLVHLYVHLGEVFGLREKLPEHVTPVRFAWDCLRASNRWMLGAFVPNFVKLRAGTRVEVASLDWRIHQESFPATAVGLAALLTPWLYAVSVRGPPGPPRVRGLGVHLAASVALYSVLIVGGRALPRGFDAVFQFNTYYSYHFNLLLVLLLGWVMRGRQPRWLWGASVVPVLRITWIGALLAVALWSLPRIIELNWTLVARTRDEVSLIGRVAGLVSERRGHEGHSSIAVSEYCRGNTPIQGMPPGGRGDAPRLAQVLFPKSVGPCGGDLQLLPWSVDQALGTTSIAALSSRWVPIRSARASSALPRYGPELVADGNLWNATQAWHCDPSLPFPHWIDVSTVKPVRLGFLGVQAQAGSGDNMMRAPRSILLESLDAEGAPQTLGRYELFSPTVPGEWCFIPVDRPHRPATRFRLTCFSNHGDSRLITIQELALIKATHQMDASASAAAR